MAPSTSFEVGPAQAGPLRVLPSTEHAHTSRSARHTVPYDGTLPPALSPSKRHRSAAADTYFSLHPHYAGAVLKQDHLSKALKAVCKVFATTACPNFANPWQMHAQHKSTASAWIVAPVEARRLLTNAHAVANNIQVQVRKHGLAKKFNAKVLAVGHECDIAMLTVEEDEFWQGVEALEIANDLPAQQESVSVVGFPMGGDNICVTKGVVSRIDRQTYSHGSTSLLTLQIDAAINSGNSGGPVLLGDKVIGIAFQCLSSGEGIGYVIPVPVIQHFLDDLVRHGGRYTGFCGLGASWQSLESLDHRAALDMPEHLTGIYITAVEPCYPAAEVLQPGDVLTHFNGHAIADDGTFLFEPHHQSRYSQPYTPQQQTADLLRPPRDDTHLLSPTKHTAASTTPLQLKQAEDTDIAAGTQSDQQKNGGDGGGAPAAVEDKEGGLQRAPTLSLSLSLALPSSPPASPKHDMSSDAKALQAVASPLHFPLPASPPHQMSHHKQQAARIDFRHLVSMAFDGDECELGVWRDGKQLPSVRVTLTIPKQLVPVHSHDVKPQYFIFGGLVFTTLTCFYLRAVYGPNWSSKAPVKLCERALGGKLHEEGQEVVVLSKVLAWPDVNQGYQDLGNIQVLKVAGVEVHNLSHLAHILTALCPEDTTTSDTREEDTTAGSQDSAAASAGGSNSNNSGRSPYVRLDLEWNKVVVLHVPRCHKALPDILQQNCIPGVGCWPRDLVSKGAEGLPDRVREATDRVLGRGQLAVTDGVFPQHSIASSL